MYSQKIPKTVARWAEKNKAIVEKLWVAYDDFEPTKGSYSLWCYLKPGFVVNEVHQLHEATAKDFLESASEISSCDCDDCLKLLSVQ